MEDSKYFKMVKALYISVLRPLVIEKVKDSESQVDDIVLDVLDKVFDVD